MCLGGSAFQVPGQPAIHPMPTLIPPQTYGGWQPSRAELHALPIDTLKSALAARGVQFAPGIPKEELVRRLLDAWQGAQEQPGSMPTTVGAIQ